MPAGRSWLDDWNLDPLVEFRVLSLFKPSRYLNQKFFLLCPLVYFDIHVSSFSIWISQYPAHINGLVHSCQLFLRFEKHEPADIESFDAFYLSLSLGHTRQVHRAIISFPWRSFSPVRPAAEVREVIMAPSTRS